MRQSSIAFIPKYYPATYIWLLIYFGGFILLIAYSLIISTLPVAEGNWRGIYWGIGFGVAALYEGGKLIKAVEFNENEIVVHYFIRKQKTIEYREIKGLNVEWAYLDTKKTKIYYHGMKNQEELLVKATDILRRKNILKINIEEEERKDFSARNKRLRFAFIFTVAVGLVAEFVGNADWSYFYIILILYFVLAYQILRLFIK